jgi:hypothetical protein
MGPVPEIIDPVFEKTRPIRSFSMTENERFGLVFTKTRVYKFGHRAYLSLLSKPAAGEKYIEQGGKDNPPPPQRTGWLRRHYLWEPRHDCRVREGASSRAPL